MASEDLWLSDAIQVCSPNYNARPQGSNIDLLVIHNISLPPGEFGGKFVEAFFCNQLDIGCHPYFDTIKDLRVSAHLLIERTGRLVQFVPLNQRAWHAGMSVFEERESCNDFSIGIELEGTDDVPYTKKQYHQLASVTKQIMTFFPKITDKRIVGHADIAPGRKTDPGPSFDWPRYRQLITT